MSSSLEETYHEHNECYDEQNMDKPAHGVTAYQPQQPQNYQYYGDCPQHLFLLSDCSGHLAHGSSPANNPCIPEPNYPVVIRFFTLFTPFTSVTYLVATSFSAVFLALPVNVTTPRFVEIEVLIALVER